MGTATLDADQAVRYLHERGVLVGDEPASVHELQGGVSGVALLVETLSRRVVIKQAMPRLRVAREWYSDPARAVVEARALEAFGRLTPAATPALLDIDPDRHAFTMTAAPPAARTWKDELLAGHVDASVATRVGDILGRWHAGTADDASTAARFDDRRWFMELRVTPFYQAVKKARPDLAAMIDVHLAALLVERRALVHGDYSPKNVLVAGDRVPWIVDFEVAHFGDPTFDLAFMLHHLLLKAIHLPRHATALLGCAQAFLTSYRAVCPTPTVRQHHLLAHVGCLVLARVLGTSPASYLTAADRIRAEEEGARIVRDPARTLAAVWPVPGDDPR